MQQIDLERIDGATYGLSGILSEWQQLILRRRPVHCDTLIVNLLTFLRNAYEKDMQFETVANQVATDMNVLTFHFSEYIKNLRSLDNPSVIFYIPSYHKFPTFHLRPESPSNAILSNLMKRFVKEVYPQERYDFSHGYLRIHVVHAGKMNFPHHELYKHIDILTSDCVKRALRDYWMISHVPLDYHLVEKLHGRCHVQDSHTGNFWNAPSLGEKVFKNTSVPFNSVTHLMFGDKILVKCLLNRRDKQRALETAVREKWHTKTKQQILKQATAWLPEQVLTSVRL